MLKIFYKDPINTTKLIKHKIFIIFDRETAGQPAN